MSTAAFLLRLIFEYVGFILSFKGLFVFLLGVIGFIALPVVPLVTGEFKRLANFHLYLGMAMLGRAAIVVSEHGELLLKRMSFDDLGVEQIAFGNGKKDFEDPDASLHWWMDMPFALADERSGVLFDPRHAALGNRKRDALERGERTIRATQYEWDTWGVHEWKQGLYEFPKGVRELVDLAGVRQLVDGGERAEYPKRVQELYKHSRDPFNDGTSATRFILILFALLGPFAMLWLLATQGDTGGSGGAGSTVTGLGQGAFLLLASSGVLPSKENARFIGKLLLVALPLPTVFLLVGVLVSPFLAVFAAITLVGGFFFVPLITVLARASDKLSTTFSRLLFRTGLMGYDKPVLEWTPEKYQLLEASDLETTEDVTWYGLSGSLLGFTFKPDSQSWGAEVMEHDTIDAKREVVADGGSPDNSNIPAGYTRMPSMKRASSYAGFVPTRIDSDHYYLNTGIADGRFRDSSNGEKSLNRLLWAKEKFGNPTRLSDKAMIYAMIGCGVVSMGLGVFVFFL